jgi:uncharacterized tellurite resistance protein B-like protein
MALTDILTSWLAHIRAPSAGRTPPPPLPEPDAQLALGALLVRVARADRSYLFEELQQIDRILAARNGLGPIEAAKMRATCERLERAFPDTHHLTALIRTAVPEGERRAMAAALWRVALADGLEAENESALVHLIEAQLGVDAQDSAAARAAAAAGDATGAGG